MRFQFYFTLDEHGEPQPCGDLDVWAVWMEQARRDRRLVIAQDKDESGDGTIMVSTVFLGLNHNWGSGPPILFETLVFGSVLDGEMDRYFTRDEAFRGHLAMCARVRATLHPHDAAGD